MLKKCDIFIIENIERNQFVKIYFVRHGHPDYKNDCLTELGQRQAHATANRLKDSKIERVFASTQGRAVQTAEYTANLLGLDVIPCDFIREIGWYSIDGKQIYANGQPWLVADSFVAEGKSVADKNWMLSERFSNSVVVKSVKTVSNGLDVLLENLGYKREGEYYRVMENDIYKTVAIFSHAGSSTAAISHMLNIPFPQFCEILDVECTSITIIELSGENGSLVSPKIRLLNDTKHIETLFGENVYGN